MYFSNNRALPYIDFAIAYDSIKVELLYVSKFLTEDGTHLMNWFIGPNFRELEQVRDMRITKYSLKSCHTLFMQHYATLRNFHSSRFICSI